MTRMQATLSIALATCIGALAASAASAQTLYKSGRTVHIDEHRDLFPKATTACLKLCTDMIIERQTFECDPYFLPPIDGCDLKWIDSYDPNPDFSRLGDLCVPSEPELGGYLLDERVERIRRQVRQGPDCQSIVTDTVISTLADRNNPPRPCPDGGPWASSNETILSISFVACR
jgi:hypothetical protein